MQNLHCSLLVFEHHGRLCSRTQYILAYHLCQIQHRGQVCRMHIGATCTLQLVCLCQGGQLCIHFIVSARNIVLATMIPHYWTQGQSRMTMELSRKHQEPLEPLMDQALWTGWMTGNQHCFHSCLEEVFAISSGEGKGMQSLLTGV